MKQEILGGRRILSICPDGSEKYMTEQKESCALVFDIYRGITHDGPGMRTTLFILKIYQTHIASKKLIEFGK